MGRKWLGTCLSEQSPVAVAGLSQPRLMLHHVHVQSSAHLGSVLCQVHLVQVRGLTDTYLHAWRRI